jgi:hypothetical protein
MLKSKKFWSYEICEKFDLTEEMFQNYKKKGKFYEDGLYFYDQIGIGAHPAIKATQGNIPSVITFQNVLVDTNTIKILFYLLPSSKVTSLRFSSNKFNLQNLEFIIENLFTTENGINTIIYEWNDTITIDNKEYSIGDLKSIENENLLNDLKKTQDLILSFMTRVPNKLEALCLRGDLIGDEMANRIFDELKNKDNTIKILNLFRNNLTNECINNFCEMITVNTQLEDINLGRNFFNDDCLNLIKDNYGIFPMTQEEVDEYGKLAKERQDIINKNIKLKASKKPELEVPHLDEMKEIDGKHFRVKNGTLKKINFIQNNFTQNSFDNFKIILDANQDLCLAIDYKIFNEEQINIFTDSNLNYLNRVYLSK